jgi:hypothetical protein
MYIKVKNPIVECGALPDELISPALKHLKILVELLRSCSFIDLHKRQHMKDQNEFDSVEF